MRQLIILAAVTAAFVSCAIEPLQEMVPEQQEPTCTREDSVTVSFRISNAFTTRSSIHPDEEGVQNINLYAYRDGSLQEHLYSESPTVVLMSLPKSYTYSVYALANTGKVTPPVSEDDIATLTYSIGSLSDLEEVLPMSWSQTGISVGASAKTVSVTLERLTSKLWFNIDSSLLEGVTVTSARLCQSASVVRPFAASSKATSASEVINGDYASDIDLQDLYDGDGIFFYALENCQGRLLPNNDDPWGKTPEALGGNAGLCTYIEVECEFEEGFLYSGTVTYRFYPGDDNTSDFSIRRNSEMDITLCLTGEGIREVSWKVDPDVEVQDGYADGWLDEGRHAVSNLYVGEQFNYGVEVAEKLLTHLGGDLSKCSLRMVSSDGGSIRFEAADSNEGNTVMYAYGTCTGVGTGSLWLCDPDGNPVAEVGAGVKVQKPKMVVSFYSSVGVSETDFSLDEPPCCTINGENEKLHIYLTDSNGYNLNTDYWSGFDLSLFSFESDPYKESDYYITDNIDITLSAGTANSEGPAATYTISCDNDGRHPDINYDLCCAVDEYEAFYFDIDENNYSISGSAWVGITYEDITLTVVDNGWAGYFDCQASLKVDNPSNLPLTIRAWQVNSSNSDWNAISRNEIIDDVEDNMTVSRASYITNAFYDSDVPLYGNGITIYSERNSDGDQYESDGDLMVYPLEGLETNDCLYVQLYDKRGQEALFHLFDVRFPTGRVHPSKLSVVDNLENGTMKYSIIYGDDPENPGWNNQGMWLWTDGTSVSKSATSLDGFNNITAKNLYNLMNRYDRYGPYNLVLTYNQSAGQLYASCTSGNLFGIKLDVQITGTVTGYVKTYPNGTWGSGKDNNCSATISKTLTGITVGTGNTSIDGGAIKAGMDAIYAQTFYDSRNWIGSANNYQHAAHPTAVSVTLKIKVNGSSELYPITVTWSDTTLPYYHSQDGTTYNPSFSRSDTKFDFIRLKRN